MKPVFGQLRSLGYLSVIYIDDSYLQGQTYEECCNNVQSTSNLISELVSVLMKISQNSVLLKSLFF